MAIGIGNLAGAVAEAIVLNVATKRASGVSPYRPLVRPLAIALLSGGLGLVLCIEGPEGLMTAIAAGGLTLALSAVGLWLVCRKDLTDIVGLGVGSLRRVMPRLRRQATHAA
jgi:hypothetical protein